MGYYFYYAEGYREEGYSTSANGQSFESTSREIYSVALSSPNQLAKIVSSADKAEEFQ